jgi:predicted nucleic acid-binding protein
VLTVGEIVKGIALMSPGPKKKHLTRWLAGIESDYEERILPLDVETARIWGELTARAQKKGIIIPPAAGLLAATALQHGLHVMTRNTKHFEASGVFVIDPWQGS